jgi:uncharacterized membrane protein
MKHHCPHCGVSLKLRLVTSVPLPGQRSVLPLLAVPVCPSCRGKLANNSHWSEAVAVAIVALPALVFSNIRHLLSPSSALWLGSAVLVAWVALFAYFHFRYWRTWERYKPYVAPHVR